MLWFFTRNYGSQYGILWVGFFGRDYASQLWVVTAKNPVFPLSITGNYGQLRVIMGNYGWSGSGSIKFLDSLEHVLLEIEDNGCFFKKSIWPQH